MCVDFIRVIPHMAREYKHTPVITRRVQEADHIHIIASCSAKKKKKDLRKQITTTAHRKTDTNICKAPPFAFFCLGCGPLKRAKQWQDDIEKKSSVYRMKEDRRREERKGCTLIQLAALARSNYLYSP